MIRSRVQCQSWLLNGAIAATLTAARRLRRIMTVLE